MRSSRFNWSICSALICGLVVSSAGASSAFYRRGLTTPVIIKIKVPKKVFQIDEPVEGQVILTNLSPSNMPAVFEIRIFHDDQLTAALSTALKGVPQGTTRFAFKNFGIPAVTKGPEAEGAWRIRIFQQGRSPSEAVEVTIRVVPLADTPEGRE